MSGEQREAYRLRKSTRTKRGWHEMRPIPGEERIFGTWREAVEAAKAIGGRLAGVVTQAVLIDGSGRVVFPDAGSAVRSRGMAHAAHSIRREPGPRPQGKTPRKRAPPVRKPQPEDLRPRAERSLKKSLRLDPRVSRRIDSIRQRAPEFGRGKPRTFRELSGVDPDKVLPDEPDER